MFSDFIALDNKKAAYIKYMFRPELLCSSNTSYSLLAPPLQFMGEIKLY